MEPERRTTPLTADRPFDPAAVAAWSQGHWTPAPPALLRGVVHDSRAIRPGNLYVALPGATVDGHDYVAAAFANGAAAAMVAADWQAPAECAGLPLLRVDQTLTALGRLGHAWSQQLNPFMIGVSGSVGKSTLTSWTAALLATKATTAATCGNYNTDVGLPLSLLQMVPGTRYGVFELGMSHPGELAPLCRILAPAAAIMGTIGAVHLEHFPSVAAIAAEKATLLRATPASGFAVVDADSPWLQLLRQATAARLVTVSLTQTDADYYISASDDCCGSFTLHARDLAQPLQLTLQRPGRHVILNALLALAAARQCGVTWEAIAATLPRLPGMAMRWEQQQLHGVTVINDAYNASPLSMAAAIRSFAAATSGRQVLLLGEMRELGAAAAGFHHDIGCTVAASGCAVLVGVGQGGAWIADAAREHGFAGAIHTTADTTTAGHLLSDLLQPGDALLLKASRGVALERALALWQEAAK